MLSGQISSQEATIEAIKYTQTGRKKTPEEIMKITEFMRSEKHPFRGKKHTQASKDKIRKNHKGNTGKTLSEEWKLKISKSHIGKNYLKGMPKSSEHRAAMSIAARKAWAVRKAGG